MPKREAAPGPSIPPPGRGRFACAEQIAIDEVAELEHIPGDPEFTAAYAAALQARARPFEARFEGSDSPTTTA